MHNIRLIVAYDGGAYLGWQKTPIGPSIEAALEKVLTQILQHPIALQAASRTDRGVHARGQSVNFLTSKAEVDLDQLRIGLNSLLPKDIVVFKAEAMPPSFHPTLDCIGKEYRYYLCLDEVQLPQHRSYSWHQRYPIDLLKIGAAIPLLIGTHDFTAFCNFKKNARYTDYIREVRAIHLEELEDNRLCFRIQGNHFLYKMVRNLVGTLIDVGRGRIAIEDLKTILAEKSRPLAGVTAPAHGLFLYEIFYPSDSCKTIGNGALCF